MKMNKVLDAIFIAFFALHIPITLVIDAQVILPPQYYPNWCRELLNMWVEMSGDTLMMQHPLWFKSLVLSELLFQLPFFFVAVFAFTYKEDWIRIPSILYGKILSSESLHRNHETVEREFCK